ncbi:hypothetical protein FSP39_002884 [Pinctada imbricata]|uniref:protein O-GlcNAcase n=1 Tax=Pinctada imbricata TaxID=66713 RepID=A0AA88Y565_PINIB|nr:hypothetical protein FSP39_002884 [Pinctada imbricata]
MINFALNVNYSFRLKKMGLSTYMYAPKDDCKHRAFWRDLYSVEEAESLAALIEAAKEQNVEFVYALSPGLDITFSNAKDVQFLKRKFEQVSTFGCTAFALLFDDIEPELSETDRSMFQSFGAAQVSVTNEVYQHLGQPHFFFCPTEYCSSRAVPNLSTSDYLNTLGAKLLSDIDILWTGQKVISKKITVQHLQDVTAVLQRPPVIWDNIHANDYDPRRLFLGPFDGRSPEVIPYLRGVLTNPNCEFESNFIALHTLGQWSQSNLTGVKKDILEDFPAKLDTRYQPRVALRTALTDWIIEVKTNRLAPKVIAPVAAVPNIPTVEQANNINPLPQEAPLTLPPFVQPPVMTMNSLAPVDSPILSESDTDSTPDLEPMEYVPCGTSENVTSTLKKNLSSDSLMQVEIMSDNNMTNDKADSDVGMTSSTQEEIEIDDLHLLVEFFYTPFEHGVANVQMLNDLHWLRSNAHLMSKRNKCNPLEVEEWLEKAKKFTDTVERIGNLIRKIHVLPNTALTLELFPYLWDLQGVLQNCSAYVQWLVDDLPPQFQLLPQILPLHFKFYFQGNMRSAITTGRLYSNFLLQILELIIRLLPSEGAHDLFMMRPPEIVLKRLYQYRPYRPSDEPSVYSVCLKTCDDSMDGTEVFPELPQLIGDRIIGGLVTLSPEYCFVVEDDEGVCGYVVAALDSKDLLNKAELSWVPAMCEKYPKPNKEDLTPSDEVIMSFHNKQREVPESVLQRYPSIVRVDFIPPRVEDYSVPKRLLACALTALKTRGSIGVHVEMNVGDKCMIDHYQRMGFLPIATDSTCDDVVYLGRLI